MVYEGECVGMLLAIKLAMEEWGAQSIMISTDNHVVIKAIATTWPQPGHHFLDALHTDLEKLQRQNPGIIITIHWMLGHEGIVGNETADAEARKAVEEGSSQKGSLPPYLK